MLPAFNLNAIHASAYAFVPNPAQQTISVEVLLVSGSNATPAPKPVHVLYEAETVAVVHRFKDAGSGLVLTKVWVWRGKDANAGEREDAKLTELAKRFGTALVSSLSIVRRMSPELIHGPDRMSSGSRTLGACSCSRWRACGPAGPLTSAMIFYAAY